MPTHPRFEALHSIIRQQPHFRGLPPGEIARVATLASLRVLAKGEVLWECGDVAQAWTTILRGRIKMVRHGATSDRILEIFGPGESIGAFAVFNRMPYPASAVALEPATILLLPAQEYHALLERHPVLACAAIGELTRVHAALLGKVEGMTGHRVESRIARMFLSLSERMGRPVEGGTEIPVALSRLEIAELTGTTIETTIRVMSRWRREDVVTSSPDGFVVRSHERLHTLAER